jgi:hypothetical protein
MKRKSESSFKLSTGDGSVGINEFRTDCVQRMAYKTIGELDASYEKLLTVIIISFNKYNINFLKNHLSK